MAIIRTQAIKGSAITILGVLLGFLNMGVLAPMFLQEEEIGIIRLLLSYTSIFYIFASLGVSSMATKVFPHFSKTEKGKSIFSAIILRYILVGLVLSYLALIFFKPFLLFSNISEMANYFWLLFATVGAQIIFQNMSALFLVNGNSVITPLTKDILFRVISILGLFLMGAHLINFENFTFIYALALAIPGIIILVKALADRVFILNKDSRITALPQGIRMKEILSLSAFGFMGTSIGVLIREVDIQMVSQLINVKSTGIYTIPLFYGTLVSIPGRVMVSISSAVIGQKWKENDIAEIQNIYHKSAINQMVVGAFVWMVLACNLENLFDVMPNGHKYEQAAWVVFWIGLGQFIDISFGVNAQILVNSNRYKYLLYFSCVLLFLVVIFNLIFIPIYGLNGAALATALGYLIYNLIRWYFVKKWFRITPFNKTNLYTFLALGIVFSIVIFLPNFEGKLIHTLLSIGYKTVVITLGILTIILCTPWLPDLKDRVITYSKILKK